MSDLRALFIELIQEPTADNYLRAWEAATTGSDYNPYGGELREIDQLLSSGKIQQGHDACCAAMAGWILSPRLHFLASYAARKLGDESMAQMEYFFFNRLIQAIQSTGTGTVDQPFLVSCTSDEFDVMDANGKTRGSQTLLRNNGKVIDRVDCSDGLPLHFDITRAYETLARNMVATKKA